MHAVTKGFSIVIGTLFLAACGNESGETLSDQEKPAVLTAATLGEQDIRTSANYLATPPYRDADGQNGSRQAQVCKACHSLQAGGPNMIGPALNGFFGRQAGTQASFTYSPAMQAVEFVWTPRALDAWLALPGQFLPGNRMAFAGVFRESDRNDLIAFLLDATAKNGEK